MIKRDAEDTGRLMYDSAAIVIRIIQRDTCGKQRFRGQKKIKIRSKQVGKSNRERVPVTV